MLWRDILETCAAMDVFQNLINVQFFWQWEQIAGANTKSRPKVCAKDSRISTGIKGAAGGVKPGAVRLHFPSSPPPQIVS